MVVLAVGVEDALTMPMDRLQRRDAGKEQRVALFGGSGQVIGRDQHFLMVVFGLGDRLGEVVDRIPQRGQLGAIVQHDWLVKGGSTSPYSPSGVKPFGSRGGSARVDRPGRARQRHRSCTRADQ